MADAGAPVRIVVEGGAGRDLGESRAMTFWRVTLPLAMPGVLAAVLIVFIPTIGDYVTPTIIGGGKIPMVANLIQAQMLDIDNKPLGSAIAITAYRPLVDRRIKHP